MTTSDYLAWEAEQTERHEFVGGETFAMAGAEDRHVTVNGKKNWNLTPIPQPARICVDRFGYPRRRQLHAWRRRPVGAAPLRRQRDSVAGQCGLASHSGAAVC